MDPDGIAVNADGKLSVLGVVTPFTFPGDCKSLFLHNSFKFLRCILFAGHIELIGPYYQLIAA